MPGWSPYNYVMGNPITMIDPDGRYPIKGLLTLAKKGFRFAAKTVKGTYKGVSRKQADKLLKSNDSVFLLDKSGSTTKKAKRAMEQNKRNKKIVRHDGHDLKNGKKGLDHAQPKSGDGSHVFYSTFGIGTITITGTVINESENNNSSEQESENTQLDPVLEDIVEKSSQPSMRNTMYAANAGKLIFGNNKLGRLLDDWVNPAPIADDINGLILKMMK